MGLDYALVHLKYTIPPAIVLSYLYRPFYTALDVYKLLLLITIAVVSTIPWDSYLIRSRIWTYPPNAVLGPTLFQIPVEELFFFIIQTYNTTLLYLIISKPTFHSIYLRAESVSNNSHKLEPYVILYSKWLGRAAFALAIAQGWRMTLQRQEGTYMGLILIWACPFLLLLWSLAYQFILGLPKSNTLIPIALPTVYLWIVDALALQRGTWVIESGTKLGYQLWSGLEIEEAIFFLITNMLVVFGLVAFDNALAILDAFPSVFPHVSPIPSPAVLMRALLLSTSQYDMDRIDGLSEAVDRLRKKSRSFCLASGAFEGRVRIDLVVLYSFCRVADDLIDDASSLRDANTWIKKLKKYIDLSYAPKRDKEEVVEFIRSQFPPNVQSALLLLPTDDISSEPLYDLVKGLEMDLAFSQRQSKAKDSAFPIHDQKTLELYGSRVAGTVAQLCLELVFLHLPTTLSPSKQNPLTQAGKRMGIALQCVNIARDIAVDAAMGRVYLPTTWLQEADLTPQAVLKDPTNPKLEPVRAKLLNLAFDIYEESRGAIEQLPLGARAPMRLAVESYMEIGRVLQEEGYVVRAGRATVPKARRLRVAWRVMSA